MRNLPQEVPDSFVIHFIRDIVPVIGFARQKTKKSKPPFHSYAILTVPSLEDALFLLRCPLYFSGHQINIVPHIYLGMEASHTYWAEGSRVVFQYPSSSQTVLEAEEQNLNLDLMLDFVDSHFREDKATIISCK